MSHYVMINNLTHPVECAWDGEYVGDPLELVGSCQIITAAICPNCPDDPPEWAYEGRGYCGEQEFLQCVCGQEWALRRVS